MLKLQNNSLIANENYTISSSDTIIELDTTLSATIFGIFTLTDNSIKIVSFSKIGNYYKTRLLITEEELNILSNVSLQLQLVSETGEYNTNSINVYFDIPKIKLDIKRKSSQDFLALTKEVKSMETKLNSIISKNRMINIDIANLDNIKPGMIPVAIDDKGHFLAQYPFKDVIINVNGQTAVNGVVNVDASMIKYNKDIMLDAYIKQLAETVKALSEYVNTVNQTLFTTVESVKNLRIKLETHLDNGSL